ncbi:MAG: amidohydrolase family protein [Rubrivivax sp.]
MPLPPCRVPGPLSQPHQALAFLLLSLLLFPLLLPSVASAATAAPRAYTVLIQKQAAGHLRVAQEADGAFTSDFSYRDNGRGPDIRERFRLGALGAPVAYEGVGTSTYGAAIAERFDVEGGRLRWRSRVDSGDVAFEEGALFLPLEASLAYSGALASSLLARADGSAPVVEGNRLRLQRLATVNVEGAGGPVPLVLVAITGADASPWYFWLRDDASRAFFAVTYPGWSVVAEGYEAAADTLVQRQRQAQDEYLIGLQKRLARVLPGLTLIRNVRWFDAPAARLRGPSDVYLSGGRIARITAPGALDAQPEHVVDGQGRTLLPGLWDMHAHLGPTSGLPQLAAGVTSVRDMGNTNEALLGTKARMDAGEIPGPHIYPAGFVEGRSPFSSRNGFVIENVAEGRRAIDWYAARGYRQIKLYNSIKPEWVRPLAAHARARGMGVTGHVPAFMRAEEAVRAGYDELTHVNQLMLNFVVRPGDDTRTLLRFERVGDDGQQVDLKSPRAQAFLRLLRERRTAVDLTLVTFESYYTQAQGELAPALAAVADHLPSAWRRGLKVAETDLEGAKLATWRGAWRRMMELTLALHRAGVPLLSGTDYVPGVSLHREIELYVEAGIPAAEALRIATWNGAKSLRATADSGSIEAGKRADLVLIDGDPTQRIADIRRASLVWKGGTVYEPAALYEAMGYKPFVPAARIEKRSATP